MQYKNLAEAKGLLPSKEQCGGNLPSGRNHRFEFVRAIAIVSIVMCHYFLFGGAGDRLVPLGRFLGGVFNMVFFGLSAILYGLKWHKNGCMPFGGKSFLLKRFQKLSSSLYPFLLFLFVVFSFLGVSFTAKDVLMNVLFLGWFDRLPGNEHLWFLTMTMMCYLLFVFLSRNRNRRWNQASVWILVTAICLFLQYMLDIHGLPGYLFLILGLCGFLFIDTIRFMGWLGKVDLLWYVPVFFLLNVAILYALFNGFYEQYRSLAYVFLMVDGVLWIVFLLRFSPSSPKRWFSYMSMVSYEVYLVHHCLCGGPLSLFLHVENPYIRLLLLWVLSLLFAHVLHVVSGKLLQIQRRPKIK